MPGGRPTDGMPGAHPRTGVICRNVEESCRAKGWWRSGAGPGGQFDGNGDDNPASSAVESRLRSRSGWETWLCALLGVKRSP